MKPDDSACALPMCQVIDRGQLADARGGFWTGIDKAISYAASSWDDKACASRSKWIGWGLYSALGVVSWAAFPRTGPVGMMFAAPAIDAVGTYGQSSYIDNCERQK